MSFPHSPGCFSRKRGTSAGSILTVWIRVALATDSKPVISLGYDLVYEGLRYRQLAARSGARSIPHRYPPKPLMMQDVSAVNA